MKQYFLIWTFLVFYVSLFVLLISLLHSKNLFCGANNHMYPTLSYCLRVGMPEIKIIISHRHRRVIVMESSIHNGCHDHIFLTRRSLKGMNAPATASLAL